MSQGSRIGKRKRASNRRMEQNFNFVNQGCTHCRNVADTYIMVKGEWVEFPFCSEACVAASNWVAGVSK